jgi:DNA-directed RNA polymerase subunit N (RpoN/RPB10)
MLAPKCVSCGKFLADFQLIFEEYKNNLELNSNNMTQEDKNKKVKKFLTENYIIRWCCRTQVLTYCDQINLIL